MSRLLIASGIFHPEPGGPATYLHELLPELQTRGWDVRALAYGNAPTDGYPYPLTRIARRPFPLRQVAYARAVLPLLGWADVVYIHTLGLPLIGSRRAPRVLKIVGDQAWERAVRRGWVSPVTDIDAFQHARFSLRVEAAKAARSREVRSMDAVIVPSHYLKQMVLGWGVPDERVRVIYNALPPEHAAPQMTPAGARASLGLPDGPLLLTAARLLPWKGVDHLLAALRALPDVRLVVAGDGPELDSLKAQAVALGVADRARFLGRVGRETMPLLLRAADYLVLYSGYEGLSHTILESLRVGTPVIASDKGGNPEIVRDGVNGLLAPYVDRAALTDVLRSAFVPGRRAGLAANSAVGLERFDFAHMVAATSDFLQQGAEGR
jgi:glycosyltransferase involved in cell wall biosynthesis